jgi:SAM-dependent methyltransferase
MGFTLETVVPWGRSYDEYVSMFDLTEADLGLRILGCGDGPAGFNSALTKRGGHIVSVDPIYVFGTEQIRSRVSDTYETVMTQMRKHHSHYVWGAISSVEQLGVVRTSAMDTFFADFEAGKQEGRYLAGELPSLPFENGQFDLALSSHFLFLYSAHLSAEFHLQALLEMLRVAREVRVFPLLTLDGVPSPHAHVIIEGLSGDGYRAEIKRVSYEFQRGGNEMLVIKPV